MYKASFCKILMSKYVSIYIYLSEPMSCYHYKYNIVYYISTFFVVFFANDALKLIKKCC